MARRKDKRKWFLIGAGSMLVISVITGTVYGFLILPKTLEMIRHQVELDMKKKRAEAFVLQTGIKRGEPISLENVVKKEIDIDGLPAEEDLLNIGEIKDLVARVYIPPNLALTKSLFTKKSEEVTDDLREEYYTHIQTPPDIAVGHYVDIRIKRTNGMDYKVVAKKQIKLLNGGFYIDMHESERFLLNAASVEQELEGSILYTSRYIEPENQPVADITYSPSDEILELMEKNPEILEEALQKKQNIEAQEKESQIDGTGNQASEDVDKANVENENIKETTSNASEN